jgi:hypothetical protein
MVCEESVTAFDFMSVKQRRPGYKKPIWEGKFGRSLSTSTGELNYVSQSVDRLNNWYSKSVASPDGTKIRECEQPLDEHRGFGSDKKKL